MQENSNDTWQKAANAVVKAGMIPYNAGGPLIAILKELMTEEQAAFISVFSERPSLNLEQIREKSDLPETDILDTLEKLMFGGVVVGTKSKSRGLMVYRLLGPVPGLFEYTNLRGERGEKQKRLARLFEDLWAERKEAVKKRDYDDWVDLLKKVPPMTRIVPIEEEIGEDASDKIMPVEEVSRIVDKFDDIALAHCYCRHSKDLLDQPCQVTDERLNCILLGKSAQFAAEYQFGKLVSREEIKAVLKKAADEGLVHKAFHIHLNTDLEEEAICNCCKCCCGPFQSYHQGVSAYHCHTHYLAVVDENKCTACESCVDWCPVEAIEMVDDMARVNDQMCIGCGVCAHQCGDESISLKHTEIRKVFLPPKKIVA